MIKYVHNGLKLGHNLIKNREKKTTGVTGGVVTLNKISKAQKRISVIEKLDNILPRNVLLTIYKSLL